MRRGHGRRGAQVTDRPPCGPSASAGPAYILPVFTIAMIVYLASPIFMMIAVQLQRQLTGPERQVATRSRAARSTGGRRCSAIPATERGLATSIMVAIPASLVATALGALIGLVLGRYRFRGRGHHELRDLPRDRDPGDRARRPRCCRCSCRRRRRSGTARSCSVTSGSRSRSWRSRCARACRGWTARSRTRPRTCSPRRSRPSCRVTLPLIMPGIVAGFLLVVRALARRLRDHATSCGGPVNTFPTWVYGATRIGVPPQVNVWGTILFVVG